MKTTTAVLALFILGAIFVALAYRAIDQAIEQGGLP